MRENISTFPVYNFPKRVQEIIKGATEAYGYPAEYLSASMLVAFGTAMGNRFSLEVKEGWRERGLLYCVLVGTAGANKSHPMNFALKPLIEADIKAIKEAESNTTDYVAPNRRVASDVTQEGIVRLMDRNPTGMVLYVDELKAWVSNFSRYSSGSQEQFWLSNFSQTPIIVDRKKDAKPTSIAQPFASVLGSTQPSVLCAFSTGDRASNGFVDRLLFVYRKEPSKPYWTDSVMNEELIDSWRRLILEPILYPEEEVVARFSEEAKAIATEWQMRNVNIISSEPNEHFLGAFSKLEIYFVRFCLIMHQMSYFCGETERCDLVERESVERAIELVEYFREQVRSVEPLLYPEQGNKSKGKERQLMELLPEYFTTKDALEIAQNAGISQSMTYRTLARLNGVEIEKNELGEFYKL